MIKIYAICEIDNTPSIILEASCQRVLENCRKSNCHTKILLSFDDKESIIKQANAIGFELNFIDKDRVGCICCDDNNWKHKELHPNRDMSGKLTEEIK
jgi:hypothetical protein